VKWKLSQLANIPANWKKAAGIVAGFTMFAVALFALRHELRAYDFRQVRADLRTIPGADLWHAIGLTACGYLALILYDSLALRYVKHELPPQRVAFAGFVAYAFSNALGFPLLLGGGLRYRFYNAWGLSSAEIAMIIGFNSVTFWIGVLLIGGLAFVLEPSAAPAMMGLPVSTLYPLGVLLLALVIAYLFATAFIRKPLRVRGWEFSLPTPGLAISQLAVSSADWLFAGSVLWALIPAETPHLTFLIFITSFLFAQIAGMLSHVPAGLGVFEVVFIAMMTRYVPPAVLVGVLILFRAIYYLMPLAVAAALLGTHEVIRGKTTFAKIARTAGGWVPGVAPVLLSVTTFIGGAILLLSGATPGLPARMRLLSTLVPLAVIESSHFIASLTGAMLLVLSRGLGRRLDAAWWLTVAALTIGIIASLLKGVDYEEALVLALILCALVPARRHFYRRASLTSDMFTPAWTSMTVVALGTSIWLGFFVYQHVNYSNDLWWRFAVRGDAPRFLRATVGATAILLIVALHRMLTPVEEVTAVPVEDDETREKVKAIVRKSPDTSANLALIGRKRVLFSEDENAFIMYGVEGSSFVAMGDPVGSPSDRKELAWRFRELADRNGASTVFYQVRMHNLPLYLDLGLALLKLGEEARVGLADFSLEGGARKGLRRVVKNVEKEGCTFEIVPEADVPAVLPRLRAVSDDWLAAKRTREKAFSIGYFDDAYICSARVAVIKQGGEIVAFANLWEGAGHEELSVDLMRYASTAPDGVMDYLFIQLMLWGREQRYGHFNLGMAPLSGLENRSLAPVWSRVGALLFKHAENFYNFQGLRAYKEKFDPVWEPRYLASPGGLSLPRILTNVSALVSGSLKGVVSK
jgi:phosphatidylglycerol lysyltransferase